MQSTGFAAPILPGKLDDWKKFNEEINGPRRSEFEAQQRRLGNARQRVWLQQTPMGDFAIVFIEGDNVAESMKKMAESDDPFDAWFRDHIKDVHGMDVTEPRPPPPELVVSFDA